MENFKLSGSIKKSTYSDDEVNFVIENLFEDNDFIHIKGEVGYLDKNVIQVNEYIKMSKYDGVSFYFIYEKNKNTIKLESKYRRVMCTQNEYDEVKNDYEYIDVVKDDNDLCIPYLLLLRSKDCVLVPYLVKAMWKSNNCPKILIKI